MSDEHLNADAAFVFLRNVYTREGVDAAVQAARAYGQKTETAENTRSYVLPV
jgi:hypothetical protein